MNNGLALVCVSTQNTWATMPQVFALTFTDVSVYLPGDPPPLQLIAPSVPRRTQSVWVSSTFLAQSSSEEHTNTSMSRENFSGPVCKIRSCAMYWPGISKRDHHLNAFGPPRKRSTPNIWPTRKALENVSNLDLATNGPLSNAPRASPTPQNGPPIPNGKPTSPYSERQNPMTPNAQIAAQTVSSRDPKAAAQAASDMRNVVRRKLTGYVGFANLPNQWHRKSVRKGFNFNVMVVG